jgi:hypothetical protein
MNTAVIDIPCTKKGFQPVDATHVYCPSTNAIYDLTTNQAVWSGSPPVVGTVAALTSGYGFVNQGHFLSAEATSF